MIHRLDGADRTKRRAEPLEIERGANGSSRYEPKINCKEIRIRQDAKGPRGEEYGR